MGCGLAKKLDTRSKESKEDDSDTPQLVFSPTLSYFTKIPQSCATTDFQNRAGTTSGGSSAGNVKKYLARLAFEVDIHPGSYKIGPPSLEGILIGIIDSHFKLDETEWLTKEKGNTVIKALLVHLEQVLWIIENIGPLYCFLKKLRSCIKKLQKIREIIYAAFY